MTKAEIMEQLKQLGQEGTKKVLMKHGIPEPLYGVKIEELKKINKKIKNGHALALELYDTGVYDAMYLAGLVAEPKKMTAEQLQHWAETARAGAISEYTVAWVTAESAYGMQKALEWIEADDERLAVTGWSTLANVVTITEDSKLDAGLLKRLLARVAKEIHSSANRVKYTMNTFVIAVGVHVKDLSETARQTASKIGTVTVDMGDTACKVPAAVAYIEKVEAMGKIGKKKKSARCM